MCFCMYDDTTTCIYLIYLIYLNKWCYIVKPYKNRKMFDSKMSTICINTIWLNLKFDYDRREPQSCNWKINPGLIFSFREGDVMPCRHVYMIPEYWWIIRNDFMIDFDTTCSSIWIFDDIWVNLNDNTMILVTTDSSISVLWYY